ncbi:ATP-binding protein [Hyalangium rubrum]|uniref:histidine kinase n=1 Tax=Hyalangium rubrum TaxID=3103134 RepID=A0ABU5HBB2_9BACT|nr:ATP-binding protein [Hyalangium sp. s54d21]MDY7229405.1 ATP-binding protein [Hyalangium sp. s54d21]
MQPSLSPRTSLARSTLLKMGARIALVIFLATLFSYLHILHTLRAQALVQLEQHVRERIQREQVLFVLAEDNHAVLKKALEEKILALREEDPNPRFDRLFVYLPDGTVRSRAEGFDGKRMAGLFTPRGVAMNDDLRRRILAAHEVLNQYGPAFHTRFADTFVVLPEGAMVIYFPNGPTYCLNASATESIISQEFFPLSLPANNPARRTAWSGVYQDPSNGKWLTTVSTPLDMDGRHVATIGHDFSPNDFLGRTVTDRLPGAYNLLIRDDGQLLAHPELKLERTTGAYHIQSDAEQPDVWSTQLDAAQRRVHLRAIFAKVKQSKPGQLVHQLPAQGEYIAAARLEGPGWNFVTVLPEGVVSEPAFQAARYVLLAGVLSLLLELAIMYWVLQQQISRPLRVFTRATDQVKAGDFKVELDTARGDELGQLAGAFQLMTDEVHRREDALRKANEELEHRVEERTRELKEVHSQLMQTARQAGMAEVATNVLHNVGNVLNSVYTSAHVAKERLADLKLESVSRVTGMLQEHQADLNTFLIQDKRGRILMPFLSQLGQNLLDERREIMSLLADVGRYTEHIGDIVKLQQDYARAPRLHEPVLLEELVEDALRINSAALSRHQVRVERSLESVPSVLTDKHKVLMILINLISNAKYALDAAPAEQRLMRVRLSLPTVDRVRIEVSDNGMGIAPELRTRIFQYGFTTRKEGHGFGLHSCALAAQELEGSLKAHSEGLGQGASFTLELPCVPVQEEEHSLPGVARR